MPPLRHIQTFTVSVFIRHSFKTFIFFTGLQVRRCRAEIKRLAESLTAVCSCSTTDKANNKWTFCEAVSWLHQRILTKFTKFRIIYCERVASVRIVTAPHPLFWRKSHKVFKYIRNHPLRNVQKKSRDSDLANYIHNFEQKSVTQTVRCFCYNVPICGCDPAWPAAAEVCSGGLESKLGRIWIHSVHSLRSESSSDATGCKTAVNVRFQSWSRVSCYPGYGHI